MRPPIVWQKYLYAGVLALATLAVFFLITEGILGGKEVGTALLAMVGTFLGAAFAFRLNAGKEAALIEKERREALNRALFVVVRQYNALQSFSAQLEPFKLEHERAFNCPAFRPPTYADLTIDFESLAFLFELGDPNLLVRLSVEQEGFHQALESIRYRNDFYVETAQPLIAKLGLNRVSLPIAEYKQKLGDLVFESAVNYATIMYLRVSQAMEGLTQLQTELHASAKLCFPHGKFIKLAAEA